MTMARDGARDAFSGSALACLPVCGREDFGCGRRDGLRSDLAVLRFICSEIPEARIAKLRIARAPVRHSAHRRTAQIARHTGHK
jgi:hypothetical protein